MNSLKNMLRYRAIDALTLPNPLRSVDAEFSESVENLNIKGHHSVGRVFSSEECEQIRAAIDESISKDQCTFSDHLNYHVINTPLTLDPCIENALSDKILGTVAAYFRRKAYLADVDCRRVYPTEKETVFAGGLSSSNWHKDIRGRQLKLMVYLTDVGPEDSSFAFVPGSHGIRTFEYDESRYTDEDLRSIGEPTDWLGKRGDGMIFDTNIVHRLTRRNTATVRDTLTFYFTPGQSLRNLEFDVSQPSVAELCKEAPVYFRRVF